MFFHEMVSFDIEGPSSLGWSNTKSVRVAAVTVVRAIAEPHLGHRHQVTKVVDHGTCVSLMAPIEEVVEGNAQLYMIRLGEPSPTQTMCRRRRWGDGRRKLKQEPLPIGIAPRGRLVTFRRKHMWLGHIEHVVPDVELRRSPAPGLWLCRLGLCHRLTINTGGHTRLLKPAWWQTRRAAQLSVGQSKGRTPTYPPCSK